MRAVIAACALCIGCQTTESHTATKEPPNQTQSAQCIDSWRKAKRALTLKKQARVAMAANKGTHSASLARQKRQNKAVGFYLKIPSESTHTDSKLIQDIEKSAGDTAVRVKDIQISGPDAPNRELPKETSIPFDWTETDLISVRSVTFFVESLTPRRFAEWYKRLPTNMERMLILQRVVLMFKN